MWCFLSWQSIQCTTINGAGTSVILAKHLPLIIIQLKKDICCASIDFLNMQFIGLWWTLAWDSDSCNPHETYIVYVCSCGTWGLVPLIYSKTFELEGTATNVTKTHTHMHTHLLFKFTAFWKVFQTTSCTSPRDQVLFGTRLDSWEGAARPRNTLPTNASMCRVALLPKNGKHRPQKQELKLMLHVRRKQ